MKLGAIEGWIPLGTKFWDANGVWMSRESRNQGRWKVGFLLEPDFGGEWSMDSMGKQKSGAMEGWIPLGTKFCGRMEYGCN